MPKSLILLQTSFTLRSCISYINCYFRPKLMPSMKSPVIVAVLFVSVIATSLACQAQKKGTTKNKALLTTIKTDFEDGAKQYKVLKETLPADRFPKTFDPKTNKAETSNSGWWCSGFYPGTLLYLYEQTK